MDSHTQLVILQYVVVCCSVSHCGVLQHDDDCWDHTTQLGIPIAVCCGVLRCAAVCYSVVCCSAMMTHGITHSARDSHCSVLWCVAVCCNVLQCGVLQCDSDSWHHALSS